MNRLKTAESAIFRSRRRRTIRYNEISFLLSSYPGLSYPPQLESLTIAIRPGGPQIAKAGSTKNRHVKTYYAIVNMEVSWLVVYVTAENISGAFKTATDRYKARHPRRRVETIAVQEMADEYFNGTWRTLAPRAA
jgi:hypothetical protein